MLELCFSRQMKVPQKRKLVASAIKDATWICPPRWTNPP